MSNTEKPKASVSTLWTNVIIEDEAARICIIGGMARILFSSCGFDNPIPGKHFDVASVVRAYTEQQRLLSKALSNPPPCGGELSSWKSSEGADIAADLGLPDAAEPPHRDVPKCFSPITEDELKKLTDGMKMVEDLSNDGED